MPSTAHSTATLAPRSLPESSIRFVPPTGGDGGYVHSLNFVPGKGHWMDNADTVAVEWMARFGREIFNGFVTRRERHIRTSIEERADPDYIFNALLEITHEGVNAF